MNLIQRATNISLRPNSEWEVIAPETTTTADLYKSYIVPLAAIGPVASFIGLSVVGIGIPFLGSIRLPFLAGISSAITQYVLALLSIYLIALLINALAPTFNGEKNQMQALKLAAYSYTPAWIAGILYLLPALGMLALLAGLYSLYVLYLGLPVLMKAPKEKAVGYTAIVVVCALVLSIVIGAVATAIGGIGGMGMGMMNGAANHSMPAEASGALGELQKMDERMEAANKKMEAAQKSGDAQAQAAAATEVLGAALGGDGSVEVVDQAKLKALLPGGVAGLSRTRIEAEKSAMGAFKISKAEASYHDNANNSRSMELSITDIGGNKMFGSMFAWGMLEQDKETETGYEKMGKIDGRPTHEKFSKDRSASEYSVLVGGRYMIEAHGSNIDMATLKQAVAAIGYSKLEAMKDEGVKR